MAGPGLSRRLAAACCACLAGGLGAAVPAGGGYRVLASNEFSGTVSVIDPASLSIAATVAVGKRPRGIQVSPDGRWAYVAMSGSPIAGPGVDEKTLPPPDKAADGIGVVDLATLKLVRVLRGVSDPEQIAISRDGKLIAVSSEDTGSVVLQEAVSGRVIASVPVGSEPEGLAMSPSGRELWVALEGDDSVARVDLRAHTLTAKVQVGARARNVLLGEGGKSLFVANESAGTLSLLEAATGKVRATSTPDGGARPMGLLLSHDGRELYVSTGRDGRLLALDPHTLKTLRSVSVGGRPWGIALSPDGALLFAAAGPANEVVAVRTASFEVAGRVAVRERPWGVAIAPQP